MEGVQRRRGRLPKVPKGPKELLERMYMSTWEKGQPRIHKIYEDDGGWKCQVSWDDLKVNEYPAGVVYTRCPRKVGHAFGGKGC